MSVYFRVGNREIWNPASRVGVLFYEQLRALETLSEQPCGLTDLGSDEYQIALPAFTAFLDALLDAFGRTNHTVLWALVENTLAVALGLEARIQGTWRCVPGGYSTDILFIFDSAMPFGPVEVGTQGRGDSWQARAERFQSIWGRARVLEQTFAGGEPAPRTE